MNHLTYICFQFLSAVPPLVAHYAPQVLIIDIETTNPLTWYLIGLILGCFITGILIRYVRKMPLPGVRCPRCAERGIEQWVLPGKCCPRCNTPC